MAQHTVSQQPPDWERLAVTESFRVLMREKRRFIVPTTIFFIVYYFALPVLVGYFPELMKRRVFGPVNIAYAFALSQFVMAWVIAWIYMRVAERFDRLAKEVIAGEVRQ
jgi:uncharacterized membrane protein (DUF485 family)